MCVAGQQGLVSPSWLHDSQYQEQYHGFPTSDQLLLDQTQELWDVAGIVLLQVDQSNIYQAVQLHDDVQACVELHVQLSLHAIEVSGFGSVQYWSSINNQSILLHCTVCVITQLVFSQTQDCVQLSQLPHFHWGDALQVDLFDITQEYIFWVAEHSISSHHNNQLHVQDHSQGVSSSMKGENATLPADHCKHKSAVGWLFKIVLFTDQHTQFVLELLQVHEGLHTWVLHQYL